MLWELFLNGADLAPDSDAIDDGATTLTYDQLRNKALQFSQRISATIDTPTYIVLLAPRTTATFCAYLAAAALGSTVVPLDPTTPAQRVAAVLDSLGGGLLLTEDPDPGDWPGHQSWHVGDIRTATVTAAQSSPEATSRQSSAAYVMFTSGTTGAPKGVPVTGSAVESYVDNVRDILKLSPGDRHSQNFSLAFDLSVHDMFVTWSSGATLVLPSTRSHAMMGRYAAERRLTHWFSVPSAVTLSARNDIIIGGTYGDLRWTGFCGEPLTYDHVKCVRNSYPGSEIWNLYGPTELTIACAAYRLPSTESDIATTNGTVPIGSIFSSSEHQLNSVDEPNNPYRELAVRGLQRFDGYLYPDANAGAFVDETGRLSTSEPPEPQHWYRTGDLVEELDDGTLVHHGRRDDQVKVAGYRIEIREVEAHLRKIKRLGDVAVAHIPKPGASQEGMKILCAFYTGTDVEIDSVTNELARSLPPYMMPRHFTHVLEIPLNANGKVDRKRLAGVPGDDVN